MTGLAKRFLKAVLGCALVLAWWTIRGPGDDANHESASQIPATVWEGGGARLAIDAHASTAAKMRVSFSQGSEGRQDRSLETWEDVSAGDHAWTIDVPSGVGGYVELEAVDPKPGDELSWKLSVDGETVDEQADALEKPLQKNYAFALQAYFDDYSSGELGDD